MKRAVWLGAGLGVWLGGAAPVWAAGFAQNKHLQLAQDALDSGELDKATAELQKALGQPDNSDDTLVEIYKLQGIVALSQGNRVEARKALEKLFQANPDYVIPKGMSPKIRDLFAEVQEDVRRRRVKPVTLEFTPLSQLAAGGPALVTAKVQDLPEGARVRLFYRQAGTEAYSSAEASKQPGPQMTIGIPASDLPVESTPFALEYYLEIDDPAGRRLAGRGDSLGPLTVKVRAPGGDVAAPDPFQAAPVAEGETPWYGHWYVWTAVGVVAAGGAATAIYFATRGGASGGTLPVTITVNQ